jgi:hypothetical protein
LASSQGTQTQHSFLAIHSADDDAADDDGDNNNNNNNWGFARWQMSVA